MKSLYQELGGDDGIESIADAFYACVLGDRRLADFFEGSDMVVEQRRLSAFLNTVTGGPHRRSAIELRTAHANLVNKGLDSHHFDAFVEDLEATLDTKGFSSELIQRVIANVTSMRNDVLGL